MVEDRKSDIAGQIRSVHHTAVCVSDLRRAVDFYTRILGYKVEDELAGRNEPALGRVVGLEGAVVDWAMLRRGAHGLELFAYKRPMGARDPGRQCDVGYTHLAMQVDDADRAYRSVLAAGYVALSPPQTLRGGRTKVFYMEGPDRIVVEFIEFGATGPAA